MDDVMITMDNNKYDSKEHVNVNIKNDIKDNIKDDNIDLRS